MSPELEALAIGAMVVIYGVLFFLFLTDPKVVVWMEDVAEGISYGLRRARGLLARQGRHRSPRGRRNTPSRYAPRHRR